MALLLSAIQGSLVEQGHLLPTLECDAEREAVCAVQGVDLMLVIFCCC